MFVLLFLAAHVLMVINIAPLVEDMITGNGAGERMLIKPGFSFMRVPESELAARLEAEGRIAADFAQVYFPIRDTARLAYTAETLDPFGRQSRFTPFVHHACAWTLCHLTYGPASVAHIGIQYIAFIASFVFAFAALNAIRHLPLGLLAANACLFLTPVGLAWFERGQFSLYVAAAYLWLMLGLIRWNTVYVGLSAVFAYAKLTSLPFLFAGLGVWLLGQRDKAALLRAAGLVAVFAAVVAVMFLLYLEEGVLFLRGALRQEYLGKPDGLTLLSIWPRLLVKSTPFLLIAGGAYLFRRFWGEFENGFPFLLGAAILLTVYPTKAYDYSVPCLLGFIPFVFWWARLPANQDGNRGPVVVWGFFLFLALASKSGDTFIDYSFLGNMIYYYFAFGLLFLSLSIVRKTPPVPGTGS